MEKPEAEQVTKHRVWETTRIRVPKNPIHSADTWRGNNKNGRCVFRKGTASALTCVRRSVTACSVAPLAHVEGAGNFILLQDREKRDFLPVPTVSVRKDPF